MSVKKMLSWTFGYMGIVVRIVQLRCLQSKIEDTSVALNKSFYFIAQHVQENKYAMTLITTNFCVIIRTVYSLGETF